MSIFKIEIGTPRNDNQITNQGHGPYGKKAYKNNT